MKIEISKSNFQKLEWLAKEWFSEEGKRPMPVKKVLAEIIEETYNDASPTEYRSIQERQ